MHQRLGAGARLREPALDEEQVQPRCAARSPSPAAYRGTARAYPRRTVRAASAARDRGALRRLAGRRRDPQLGERLVDLRGQARHVETDQPPQVGDRTVVDEPVARDADRCGPATAR